VNTWATAGSGQRLDGGSSSNSSSSDRGTKRPSPASASSGAAAVAVLSEEDEIAQAIALSLADQDGSLQGSSSSAALCELPDEPSADEHGVIKIMVSAKGNMLSHCR
jgi:hypothetical protein